MRVTIFLIACLALLLPIGTGLKVAASPGPVVPEGGQSVGIVALDASGRANKIADGFFVKADLVATSYSPIEGVKDVTSLRVRLAGREQLEPISRIAAFDESRDIALLALASPLGKPYTWSAKQQVAIDDVLQLPTDLNQSVGVMRAATLRSLFSYEEHCFLILSPGVSEPYGGPVLSKEGKLVGILVRAPRLNGDYYSYVVHVLFLNNLLARLEGRTPVRVDNAENPSNCLYGLITYKGSFYLPPPPPPPPPPAPGDKPSPPKIIRKSGGVLQQSATKRVAPSYPPGVAAAGIAGAVVVELVVDEKGKVISARAISGPAELRAVSEEAARGWEFKPTTLSDVPVKVIGTITFNFNR